MSGDASKSWMKRRLGSPAFAVTCVLAAIAAVWLAWWSTPHSGSVPESLAINGYWLVPAFPRAHGPWRFAIFDQGSSLTGPDDVASTLLGHLERHGDQEVVMKLRTDHPVLGGTITFGLTGDQRWIACAAGKADAQWGTP